MPVLPALGEVYLEMEWTQCPLQHEFMLRAQYKPDNADRQWEIERLVKKIAKMQTDKTDKMKSLSSLKTDTWMTVMRSHSVGHVHCGKFTELK
jgi:hypothetical protein